MRFNGKPSTAYKAAVEALAALPLQEREQAYAEAVAAPLKQLWMEKHGLKESKGIDWRRLNGHHSGKPTMQVPYGNQTSLGDVDIYPSLPGQDHAAMFNKDGKAKVFTFQPYGLGWATLSTLVEVCKANQLEAHIYAWWAWHYPGQTLFVEVRHHE